MHITVIARGVAVSAGLLSSAVLSAQPATAVAPSDRWSAQLVLTGLRGGGELRVEPGRRDAESRVRLVLRNLPMNRPVGWDVVRGSCGDEGAPVAAAAAFRPLVTGTDGGAMGTATVPRLTPGQRYYARVFDPAEPPLDARVWGCANLSEQP
jgi:hypothetical protein